MKLYAPVFVAVVATVLSAHTLRAAQSYAVVDTGQTRCYDNRTEIAPPKPGQPFYGQDA
jgi:L-fucose mutarotase/ribose pyranase (RbsD/FucU family)